MGGGAAATAIGTASVTKFQPVSLPGQKDQTSNKQLRSNAITAMPQFKDKSLEELRFEDYYNAPVLPQTGGMA